MPTKTTTVTEGQVHSIVTSAVSRLSATTTNEGRVREIVDDAIRTALRSQGRELEGHLKSLHERLVQLEKRVR